MDFFQILVLIIIVTLTILGILRIVGRHAPVGGAPRGGDQPDAETDRTVE